MGGGFIIPEDEAPTAPAGFIVPDVDIPTTPPGPGHFLLPDVPSAVNPFQDPGGPAPSGAFLNDLVPPAVKGLVEGTTPLVSAAGAKALADVAIRQTPVGKIPFVGKGISSLIGLGGAAVGDYLGEAAADLKVPSVGEFAQQAPRHVVEGATAVTLDKVLSKAFTPAKTARELQTSLADNFMRVIGVPSQFAKNLSLDDVTGEAITSFADDIIRVTDDGLFGATGTNRTAMATRVLEREQQLGKSIGDALGTVNKREMQTVLKPGQPGYDERLRDAAQQKLFDLKKDLEKRYTDTELRDEAFGLVDTAVEELHLAFNRGELNLVTLNNLKQNHYSDKAKYVVGSAPAAVSKVANKTHQGIARMLKETVEEFYRASPYAKDTGIPDIADANSLLSSYKVMKEVLEAPAAKEMVGTPLPRGIAASNAAMVAGASHYLGQGEAGMLPAVLGGGVLLSNEMRQPWAQALAGGAKIPFVQALQMADKLAEIAPLMGRAGKVSQVGIRPLSADQAAEAASRVAEATAPNQYPDRYLPRDVNALFAKDSTAFPPELLQSPEFVKLMEAQSLPAEEQGYALSDFLTNNRDLALQYFERPGDGGYNIVKINGEERLLDMNQQSSYREMLRRTEKDPYMLTLKMNGINDGGRIVRAGKVSMPKAEEKPATVSVGDGQTRQDPGY